MYDNHVATATVISSSIFCSHVRSNA